MKRLMLALVALVILSGCGSNGVRPSDVGMVTGAIVGAAITKNPWKGAVVGGIVGSMAGGALEGGNQGGQDPYGSPYERCRDDSVQRRRNGQVISDEGTTRCRSEYVRPRPHYRQSPDDPDAVGENADLPPI